MAETAKDPQSNASVKAGPYADVLEQMHERWDRATDEWRDIREEGTTDMRYVSGDPWDAEDRQLREDAGRPVLSFDEFGQYVNQLINEVRQHKRAIRVTPVGYGANDAVAEFRQDLIRQIEYRSNAQQAYTTGFENTVQRGYGFWRIISRYVRQPNQSGGRGSAFDQELLIKALPNPDLVTVDPDIQMPDGSDMQYAWIAESWALSDYKKRWPKAKIQDFNNPLVKSAPTWMDANRIRIAEYWTIETQRRTLLLFKGAPQPDGSVADLEIFEDDLESDDQPQWAQYRGLTPDRDRVVDAPTVMKYLTNGFEVLERPTRWPGLSIPLICCFGKVLYVDEGAGSKRKILSLVRLARDPAMLLSYIRSSEAELIGLTPKVPYLVRKGSLNSDNLTNLQKSLHEPIAVIEVEVQGDGFPAGFVPEMPQRQPYSPEIDPLEIAAESARRAIQAAMGVSALPTSAQRKNEKSGKALQEIRNAEQQGSFHFIDSYEMAITRTGALLNEGIPAFYDTARDVTVRTGADEPQMRRINDPQPAQLPDGQTEPIALDREAEFDITLSTGPSFDSEREAANDFADTLLATPFASLVADLAVKLKNLGPIGDEIAERLNAMLPPPVKALEKSKGADPAQLMQQLQQMQQMVETLTQELNAKNQLIETDGVKAQMDAQVKAMQEQAETARAAEKIASDERIKLRDLEVKLEIELAKIGSAQSLARGEQEQEQLHHHDTMTLARENAATDVAQRELDRQAQADEAQAGRHFQAEQSDADRQAALASAPEAGV